MSDLVRRDRIVGGILVAIGVVGLLGTLAFGWAARNPDTDLRIGSPPWTESDGGVSGRDRLPDRTGGSRDQQRGPLWVVPGPMMRGHSDPDGWPMNPPGVDGWDWHHGQSEPDSDASPSPSPSPSATGASG